MMVHENEPNCHIMQKVTNQCVITTTYVICSNNQGHLIVQRTPKTHYHLNTCQAYDFCKTYHENGMMR